MENKYNINGSFIDDKEKMKDLFLMTRDGFLMFYSYLSEDDYETTLDDIWNNLSYICVDEEDNILEDFYIWKKGTFREDIWHWFDERVQGGIGNRYFN